MRTGVVGGTFDPPHLAHLVLAAAARCALTLDRVLFVPAGEPWRKAHREVTAAALRVRMVREAVRLLPWAEVSTIEVDRAGPSYSVDTMRTLAAEGGEWWLVIGGDALADLPHWHDPVGLAAAGRFAVAARPSAGASAGIETLAVPEEVRRAVPGIEARIDAVPMSPLDISSSDIRRRVRAGQPVATLLPEGVRAVIDEAGLYREQDG